MPHDLTAQDAELDALGTAPTNLARLISESLAGELPADLAAVDALLDALETPPEEPLPASVGDAAPTRASETPDADTRPGEGADGARGPESGEIALGDPVEGVEDVRERKAASRGESRPITEDVSGSFELPGAAPDDGAADDPAGAMQKALSSQLPDDPSAEDLDSEQESVSDGPVRPALPEDSLTAAMVSDFEPPEVTQIVPTESRAPAAGEFEIEESPTAEDPADDEFDALFEGLTSASEAPPALEDGEGGLVTQSRPIQRVMEEQQVAAYAPQDLADDFDEGATEAYSASALRDSREPPAVPRSDSLVEDIDLDELDSGELELVLDEDHSSEGDDDDGDPPNDGGDSKPPGLLGRFLGRKK